MVVCTILLHALCLKAVIKWNQKKLFGHWCVMDLVSCKSSVCMHDARYLCTRALGLKAARLSARDDRLSCIQVVSINTTLVTSPAAPCAYQAYHFRMDGGCYAY